MTSQSCPSSSQEGSDPKPFQPDIGQMLWGQEPQSCECPQILDAALEFIRAELQRVLWNLRQREIDPFSNSAASFACDTFTVCAYSWSDEPQPWNFKHHARGIEVSWYKYAGRGMSVNRAVDPAEVADLLRECIDALRAVEKGAPWSQPGLYPEAPDVADGSAATTTGNSGMTSKTPSEQEASDE